MRTLLAAMAAVIFLTPQARGADAPKPLTPGAVLAAAPASDWRLVKPENLLVIDLAKGGRIAIELAPDFAPVHVANIQALARLHWYDGLFIERVQDDYVTQWGDPSGKKEVPKSIVQNPPAEYEKPAADVPFEPLPYRDTYADQTGFSGGWPVAETDGQAWLTHCYGMVGVGRDLNPDTGTGSELYAAIGHAPRPLDRNIAVVGRVLGGMDILSSFPRGTADLGMYDKPSQFVSIRRVRLASDLPAAERPAYEVLRTDSDTFHMWVKVKANRRDDFFLHPAGAVDVCTVLPPLREHKALGDRTAKPPHLSRPRKPKRA